MDDARLIRLPAFAFDLELAEVAAAIRLVESGGARRVTLSGLQKADQIALEALALAQAAGVRFALQRERPNGLPTIVVGPLEE